MTTNWNWDKVYTDDDSVCLQDSENKKQRWLDEARRVFPVGVRVRVLSSDAEEEVGLLGTVADYDLGAGGCWPTIGVTFDRPTLVEGTVLDRDGFYESEIVRTED